MTFEKVSVVARQQGPTVTRLRRWSRKCPTCCGTLSRESSLANNNRFRPWWRFPHRGPFAAVAATGLFPGFNPDDHETCGAADWGLGRAQSIGVTELRIGTHVRTRHGFKYAGISFPGNQARPKRRAETFLLRNKRKLDQLRPSQVREVKYVMRPHDPRTAKHERKSAVFCADEMDGQFLDVDFVVAT